MLNTPNLKIPNLKCSKIQNSLSMYQHPQNFEFQTISDQISNMECSICVGFPVFIKAPIMTEILVFVSYGWQNNFIDGLHLTLWTLGVHTDIELEKCIKNCKQIPSDKYDQKIWWCYFLKKLAFVQKCHLEWVLYIIPSFGFLRHSAKFHDSMGNSVEIINFIKDCSPNFQFFDNFFGGINYTKHKIDIFTTFKCTI